MRHSVGVSIPTCNFGGSRFDYRFDMHQPFFLSLQFAEIQQLQDVDERRSLLILIKFKGFFVVGLLTLSSQINLTPPLQQDLFDVKHFTSNSITAYRYRFQYIVTLLIPT